ncbi:MAG: Ig-like domain-containing protein [Lachnospiraceae bacterium]|nr:Ig-like domain-containing protein [Lachnospiraceae bacterium]
MKKTKRKTGGIVLSGLCILALGFSSGNICVRATDVSPGVTLSDEQTDSSGENENNTDDKDTESEESGETQDGEDASGEEDDSGGNGENTEGERESFGSGETKDTDVYKTDNETENEEVEQTVTDDDSDEEEDEEEEETVAVTAIEIADHETEVKVGSTLTLSATVLPSNATNSTVTFTSSDTAIATVNSSGEVKGISKGSVIIYASADGVTTEIPLSVIVSTTKIVLESNYLILKQGGSYQLKPSVLPAEAEQALTYKSSDTSVATVSSGGLVTAKAVGSTTIIVSNGDLMVPVSVIVNDFYDESEDNLELISEIMNSESYEITVYAQQLSVIDEEMLKFFYENKKILTVIGDGYTFTIEGEQIENYKNEMKTDIELEESDEIAFCMNDGENMCGPVTLYLDHAEGKYLYLYNVSKDKYELISAASLEEITITTPGQYRIVNKKLADRDKSILIILITGTAAVITGVVAYIVIKKKYWFW